MKLGLIALLLAFASTAIAADKKIVKDAEGNCMASVPADWAVSTGSGESPDEKVSIVLVSVAPRLDTMDAVRNHLTATYRKDKVVKDSPSEIEMQGESFAGKPNFVRAVPAGKRFCIAEVVYADGSAASAQKLIETAKAAE